MSEPDPTLRGQELGEELRKLREKAGLKIADVAVRIDVSQSKLSRLETGRRNAQVEDVAALLAIYGVVGAKRRELLDLAREADRLGWWQRDRPDFQARQRTLISLESQADQIINFEGMNMPGLLQTGEYTRSLMLECGMVPQDEVEDRMVTRLRRHSVLHRERPPQLLAIIDELVLRRIIGGVDVLRRQFDHLVELSARPNIKIRVVPNQQAHPGLTGSFAILRRTGAPVVVFLENMTSSLFLEERREVAQYEGAVRKLLATAHSEEHSRVLIAALARRLETEASVP
ncbi:helix-turn-helix domain-containing protein [Streptoalloteichus hindustanus]|uniref:Helix-turn-helix domain-containing protein n=1 Tax=Streptoalloteichus hindustanus TaxID=2017 RepID=A0A1M5GLP5_STRHI|nr:helix-turn-helix transcriptional regulator [Streptoalloteichus hindustanus]SHG04606.1 Helix-turn-helix domain-containing protein [Streptoalloteichus hindustanus]